MDIINTAEIKVCPTQRAASLAEQLFALDEPWRSRFLEFVVSRVRTADGTPSQDELASWLENHKLYQQVHSMLRMWVQGG